MGHYETGIITKNRILDTYRELFYKKGYNRTTFKDIFDITGINQGLITYYYKSKKLIAGKIYTDFWMHIKESVKEYLLKKFNSYDLRIGTIIEHILFSSLIFHDKKLKHFVYEVSTEGILMNYDFQPLLNFWILHDEEYNLNMPPEQLKMFVVGSLGLWVGMRIKYMDGYLDVSMEEYIGFLTRMMYQPLGVPDSRIEEIVEESFRIYRDMSVTLNDYFTLSIE